MLAQHVGDGEHHIRGGDALGDRAGELESHDARHEHRDGLAEHSGLGFDAAHAPAEHAQAIDGGRVGVGAHAGIKVCEGGVALRLRHDALGKVFDVDLVDDAGPRRHDAEVLERLLTPAQELVAFLVALVFDVHVLFDGVRHAGDIDLHGMVDDHLCRDLRVDDLGVAAQVLHRVTHGRQVDDAGHAGEILHDDTARGELDLMARLCGGVPIEQRLDMVVGDVLAVDVAHEVLDEHLERVWQVVDAGKVSDVVVIESLSVDLKPGEL